MSKRELWAVEIFSDQEWVPWVGSASVTCNSADAWKRHHERQYPPYDGARSRVVRYVPAEEVEHEIRKHLEEAAELLREMLNVGSHSDYSPARKADWLKRDRELGESEKEYG